MAVKAQTLTDLYAIYHGDCIETMRRFRDASVHISVYSPPFATSMGGLYHYTSSIS